MNTRIFAAAALAFAAAGGAFAQEATYELPQPVAASTSTRAAVQAELAGGRALGLAVASEAGAPALRAAPASTLTRAEVRAAAVAAQADPAWRGVTGESNAFELALTPSATRVALAR